MKDITGTVVVAGDDITTEMICPAKHRAGKRTEIAKHLLKDLPEFSGKKLPDSSIIVAGNRFGLGDDAENTARALLAGGVRCIIARSFPREFFRPAINAGLPLITADLSGHFDGGEQICVNLRRGVIIVDGGEIEVGKYGERVARIVESGGLINSVRKELGKD